MAQQQKPPDLDANGQPIIDNKPPDIPAETKDGLNDLIINENKPPQQGMLSKVWDKLSSPLWEGPSRAAKAIGDFVDKPQLPVDVFGDNSMLGKVEDFGNVGRATMAGFGAGALQGIGDTLSSFTSPIDLGATLLSGGSSLAAKAGLKTVSRGLSLGSRAASIPVALHGAGNIVNPESTLGERGQGALELAGGVLGMRGHVGQVADEIASPRVLEPEIIDRNSEFFNKNKSNAAIPVNRFEPDFSTMTGAGGGDLSQPVVFVKDNRTGSGQYMSPSDLNFIYDVARKEGRILPDPPPEIKSQMSPSVFGNVEKNITPISEVTRNDGSSVPMIPTEQKIGSVIQLENPTLESIKKAREQGFEVHGGLDTDGKLKMVFTGKPFDEILESETGVGRKRVGPSVDKKKNSPITEALNTPRAIMASTDFSAPGRQGLGLIHKKEFWKSFGPMFKSWLSEDSFNEIQKSISDKPLFKTRMTPELVDGKPVIDRATGKPKMKQTTSLAEEMGLKLTDLTDLSSREEAIMSTWAEKFPELLGGKESGPVRRSNRAYTAYLNKLRADTFESLVKSSKAIGSGGEMNKPLMKELAEFVNNATGRGSLEFGKVNLERQATALNTIFFSPRLIASRLQMMNPANYLMGHPSVRKEYLKSILAIGAAGNMVLALGNQLGGEVEIDPRSKDFAKLKFDNGVRLDPWGGFQQYLTQTARQIPNLKNIGNQIGLDLPNIGGVAKSSETGNVYTMGEKFGTNSRLDEAMRFGEQKMNPVLTLITRAMAGEDFDGTPFNLPEQVLQRFVPIFLADLKQLATEDPDLLPFPENYLDNFTPENLPFAVPAAFGMGMQQYKK